MREVYIAAAARTPIGDFLSSLSSLSAVDLGLKVTAAVLEKAGLAPGAVSEVVAGMIYKAGVKGNPARQIQLGAGCPVEGIACTIDQQCASGMRAVDVLSQQITLGRTDVGVAVGTESMSNAPYIAARVRSGLRMGDSALIDSITHEGLNCAICDYHMGVTAENLAHDYKISREEQDELACLSHARAIAAQKSGRFNDEIVPVEIIGRKGAVTVVDKDEHPKETSLESLSKLKPAFKKDGTVTAGNASGINDGAAALLLAAKEAVNKWQLKPLGKILGIASVGVAPDKMGIGPVYALPKALAYAGLSLADIGYFEINEAFAAQFLACDRELKLNMDKVNGNGSGIGLGHPVGCTGVRIIVSLLYEMKRRGVRYGAASLCVGGGPAMATIVESL
ncbi:MAG: acetyl-CoA C-acyltransferase [Deltaproteobacteria bacterium]|jgi:acetyl-CoA C-acetyltransferase|nr:acetyl-CoA C-acyltransferase [Deltaproteobacteria bacterium]